MICTDTPTAVLIQSPRSKSLLSRLFERIMDLFKRIFCRNELPNSSESLQGRVKTTPAVAPEVVVIHEEVPPVCAKPEAPKEEVLFSFEAPRGLTAAELLDRRMQAEKGVVQEEVSLPRQEFVFPSFETIFQSFLDAQPKQAVEVREEKTEAPRSLSALELLNQRLGLPLDAPLF